IVIDEDIQRRGDLRCVENLELGQEIVVDFSGARVVDVEQRDVGEPAAALGEDHRLIGRLIVGESLGSGVVDDVLRARGSRAQLIGPCVHRDYTAYYAHADTRYGGRRRVEIRARHGKVHVDRADSGSDVDHAKVERSRIRRGKAGLQD